MKSETDEYKILNTQETKEDKKTVENLNFLNILESKNNQVYSKSISSKSNSSNKSDQNKNCFNSKESNVKLEKKSTKFIQQNNIFIYNNIIDNRNLTYLENLQKLELPMRTKQK